MAIEYAQCAAVSTRRVILILEDDPIIGMMLGIALGIDYALLMVTRFREWRAMGLDPEAATVATLDTAGRAVLVAGGTVMVSMLVPLSAHQTPV